MSCSSPHSPFLWCGPDCTNPAPEPPEAPEMSVPSWSSCSCSVCKASAQESKMIEKSMSIPVSTQNVGFIPVPACSIHTTYKADYCNSCRIEALVLAAADLSKVGSMGWNEKYTFYCALKAGLRFVGDSTDNVLVVMVEAIYADWDRMTEILPGDIECAECGEYVSATLPGDSDHWELVCGDCYNHTDSGLCQICENCGSHTNDGECECCSTCGNQPGYCECCSYCGNGPGECECRMCEECDSHAQYCGCGSSPYKFGSSKVVQWAAESDLYAEMDGVPDMSDLDKNVDPVRAAADFYLLGAMADLVRMSQISGSERTMSILADRDRLVRNDDMLSCWVTSARRSYSALVERLDANFLAYAISAVGGELRYHRACANDWASSNRSSAWDQFVEIVRENGPQVLFDAHDLFEEFGSSSYGGTKWAVAAKIVGQRLSGKMPAWLFVDRMFTLEHNGGCFLNKVNWGVSNGLGYGLSHMRKVLDAHAAADTDWDLLLKVASPTVRDMFSKTEARLSVLARRIGGELAPIVRSTAKRETRNANGQCVDCSYYSCVCGTDEF